MCTPGLFHGGSLYRWSPPPRQEGMAASFITSQCDILPESRVVGCRNLKI